MLKAILYTLNALIFLGLTGYLTIAALDEWETRAPEASAREAREAGPAPVHAGSGRAFVLLVESWRARTAISLELMPDLAGLRAKGISATVASVYDAATEPAVHAAFTGEARLRALAAVQSFLRPPPGIPSLFSQLAERREAAIVYSDQRTFRAFKPDLTDRRSREERGETVQARQLSQARLAAQRFVEGEGRLVVFHLTFLDAVAHRYGVWHPEYRQNVRLIDALIRELDQALAPADALLVVGDHGHTENGRHTLGLDVPTYLVARGGGFRSGVDLGLVPITAFRYLLSWALKLPLAAQYADERPVAALAAKLEELPESYQSKPQERALAGASGPVGQHLGMALGIGLAFAVWWLLGEVIHGDGRRPSGRQVGVTIALAMAGAVAFWGLGIALGEFRGAVHQPQHHTLNQLWGATLVVSLLLLRRLTPAVVGLLVFGVPFLVLFPTVYRYGAAGVFGPAWIVWAVGAFWVTVRPAAPGEGEQTVARFRRAALPCVGIIYLVQPFFFVEAQEHVFSRFVGLVPELAPTSLFVRGLVGGACAWLILYRRGQGLAGQVLAWLFALYVLAVHSRVAPLGGYLELSLGVALLAGALVAKKRARLGEIHASAPSLARSLLLAALLMLSFHVIRPSIGARLDMLMVFGALRLSVRLVEGLPPGQRGATGHTVLLLMLGLVATGWVTLGWGFARLEWRALYDYVSEEVVMGRLGHFLPLIIGRYALPVLVVRTLVSEPITDRAQGGSGFPGRETAFFVGLKYVTLLLIILGLGLGHSGSRIYLEAASQLAIFMILAIGLI